MYHPTSKEFLKLASTYNVIPVYQEINADLDTPVSSFLKMKKDDYAFLLESVEGQEKIARFSFLGSKPRLIIKSRGPHIEMVSPQQKINKRFITQSHPLEEMRKIMRDFQAASLSALPRFFGGLVGYLGYDMVRFFETIPDRNPDALKFPDAVFLLTENLLIFDHLNHTIKIVNNIILPKVQKKLSRRQKINLYQEALRKIETIRNDLHQPLLEKRHQQTRLPSAKIKSNLKKAEFKAMVSKAKTYIRRGDIIQVVLSQRFGIKTKKEPFDIYRNLRSLNPSPYMFFLKLKDVYLVGASPEMLVRCEEGRVETRPIAGTRQRGKNAEEDRILESQLLKDKKERAEHIMLVDLGRNDLGRVCQPGKVWVSEFMKIEKYSHVMHIVSEVSGVLDKRYDIYDVLKACFPAGTVSGSPKIRAMEIIDELENTRRGPYAGCVGYFSFSHNLDTCITIRTIAIKGNTAYIQAGAGIVADSVPEKEYRESVNKAKALFEAVVN